MAEPQLIDVRGLKCPLPVLKAARRMRELGSGARLVLLTDDPMAAVDVPNFCREERHRLLAVSRDGKTLRFEIEKG